MPSIRDKISEKKSKLAEPKKNEQLSPLDDYDEGGFYNVDVDEIIPDPDQPRKYFDADSLTELSQSIKQKGILQPVLIRRDSENKIWLVAGERRFRAAKIAGINKIPAILIRGNPSEIALIENLQREDLNPIEEAEALKKIMDEFDYTHDQLSSIVGKARSTVTEILTLNKLPEKMKEECRSSSVFSKRLLVEIAKQENPKKMLSLFERVKKKNLTSPELRNITRNHEERQRNTPAMVNINKIQSLSKSLSKLDMASVEDNEKTKLVEELDNLKIILERMLN
jgi:ParB family chromosome partitioning protein